MEEFLTTCPTGALGFGQLSEQNSDFVYPWFPNMKLNPAIEFTASQNNTPLKIFPESIYGQMDPKPSIKGKNISPELSLIIFSFLATVSVATIITSLIKGIYPEKIIFFPVLVMAGLVSFFHLGRKLRSWRSLMNFRNSPLSREIVILIGELLDRIIFYVDYNPLNINTLICEQLNIERDEKKRG